MRIFVDIGANEGQSLEEAIKGRWGFDRFVAFEPMPTAFKALAIRFAEDVECYNFGLLDRSGQSDVYGTNELLEASVWSAKSDVDADVVTSCRFVAASEFFSQFIPADETVIVKMNCEGAEPLILDDLIDSGEIWKVTNVMIDFDIRRVVGEEHREHDVLGRLVEIGFNRFSLCENVMVGRTHQDRIANWLSTLGL